MAKKKLTVVQNEEVVATEVLAKAIVDISEGIKKLRQGPLNDKALLLLIQHATSVKGYGKGRYGTLEIKDILDGIEGLAATYLKKKSAA